MYINAYLDTFQKRMRDAYSLGNIEDIQKELAAIMTDIYAGLGIAIEGAQKAAEEWDRMANEAGWDISKLGNQTGQNSQEAQKGSFQTLSQETGTLLLGQFTAFRIHASNIDDKISNMFLDYSVITGQLAAIAQNTANTVMELKGWRGDFKRAKDEGFKIV